MKTKRDSVFGVCLRSMDSQMARSSRRLLHEDDDEASTSAEVSAVCSSFFWSLLKWHDRLSSLHCEINVSGVSWQSISKFIQHSNDEVFVFQQSSSLGQLVVESLKVWLKVCCYLQLQVRCVLCVGVCSCSEGYEGAYCQVAASTTSDLPLLASLSTLLPVAAALVVIVAVVFIYSRLRTTPAVSAASRNNLRAKYV